MAKAARKKPKPRDIVAAGIRAVLELGAEKPWAAITLTEIADKAGLKLGDFHGVADKASLTEAIEPWLDKAMSAEAIDMEARAHDRLFDVIMLRFEAMEPYRPGLLSLIKWRQSTPSMMRSILKARKQTAEWALSCAGLDSSAEIPLPVKVLNIAWVIGRTERAWRQEECADFARTMARLDAELRACDERVGWLQRLRSWPRRDQQSAQTSDADTSQADPA